MHRFAVTAPQRKVSFYDIEADTARDALATLNTFLELKFGDVSKWQVHAPKPKVITRAMTIELRGLVAQRRQLTQVLKKIDDL